MSDKSTSSSDTSRKKGNTETAGNDTDQKTASNPNSADDHVDSDSEFEYTQDSGKRLQEILAVLRKHDIAKGLTPVKLREIMEDLGPTYVKLGQIMSMRSDMIPEKYCQELSKLRTDVNPLPFSTILTVLEKELKQPPMQIFESIDPHPLGSASIAQVHPAVLKDGRKVVLKVQRPHIHEIMEEDIRLIRKASGILKLTSTGNLIDFNTVIDELWKTSQEEMDFVKEAQNCDLFYKNNQEVVYVTSPQVIHELTTPRLLVMSYIEGIRIDQTEELTKQGYDMTEIGEKVAANYCKQILEDGFFHADPHPGNLWISGGKIAWLDLGMMGHLSESYKRLIKRAVVALLQNDIYELKNILLAMGETKERINHAALYTDIDDIVNKYMTMGFGDMHLGELIESLLDLVKEHHISINADVTMLGRSMVTIEGTLRDCSPDVNLLRILSSYMSDTLINDIDAKKELRHMVRDLYASQTKMLAIPSLLSDLLNITKNGQSKVNMELTDAKETNKTLRKGLNHLTVALLVCGLFIGSALLCLTNLTPKLLGMPWISFVGFLLCLILIIAIFIDILRNRS